MRLLKNHISVLYPEALLLLSVENEGKTDEDINSLGKNLADEINSILKILIININFILIILISFFNPIIF